MPQSQTAANPRQQEEEKKDKNIHAQNKQMYEKHKDQLPLTQARLVPTYFLLRNLWTHPKVNEH